jgi:hypothetical protein
VNHFTRFYFNILTIDRRIWLTAVSSLHVKLLIDSHSDHIPCAILGAKGSMKLQLQDIALCIFKNYVQHNISTDVEWVPKTNNDKADYISCIIDYGDWSVNQ